jgi:hypothetical protein
MGCDFYLLGALEPVVTKEGYQATAQNISASLQRNVNWFQVTDEDGHLALIHIDHLTKVVQNDLVEE